IPFGFEDGFVAVVVGELDLESAVVEEFGGSFALDFVAFLHPAQWKPIESRAYSTSRPASRAPKAISPPCAVIVSAAGPQRSRWARSQRSDPTIRQRPIKRQFAGAFTPKPPEASAAAPDCRPRPRR